MYLNLKENNKKENTKETQDQDYLRLFTDQIKEAYLNKKGTTKRIYAVMFFNTEFELGISSRPNEWVNTKNIITVDGAQALNIYANTPNPASQLLDAESIEELNQKMIEMNQNFHNKEWLEQLYEYL